MVAEMSLKMLHMVELLQMGCFDINIAQCTVLNLLYPEVLMYLFNFTFIMESVQPFFAKKHQDKKPDDYDLCH